MAAFAITDLHSRKFYGLEDASDPVAACRSLDSLHGRVRRTYERVPEVQALVTSGVAYSVHEAPDDWLRRKPLDWNSPADLPRVATVIVRETPIGAVPGAA